MLKSLFSKFNKKKITLENDKIKPIINNNDMNPFAFRSSSSMLIDIFISIMDGDYLIEDISSNVKKYTFRVNKNNYYYMVHNIYMDEKEYQKYLEKKNLKEILEKKLKNKSIEKRKKI